jgi:hypothetical protein
MERAWFKYEYGFVNIDSKNLYLTRTGNWSEIPDLTEKAQLKYSIMPKLIKGFLFIVLFISGLLMLNKLSDFGISLLSILSALGAVGGGYTLYEYLKRETGYKFLIPLYKIRSIEYSGINVTIVFKNKENREESIHLEKVELKGILILKKIEK